MPNSILTSVADIKGTAYGNTAAAELARSAAETYRKENPTIVPLQQIDRSSWVAPLRVTGSLQSGGMILGGAGKPIGGLPANADGALVGVVNPQSGALLDRGVGLRKPDNLLPKAVAKSKLISDLTHEATHATQKMPHVSGNVNARTASSYGSHPMARYSVADMDQSRVTDGTDPGYWATPEESEAHLSALKAKLWQEGNRITSAPQAKNELSKLVETPRPPIKFRTWLDRAPGAGSYTDTEHPALPSDNMLRGLRQLKEKDPKRYEQMLQSLSLLMPAVVRHSPGLSKVASPQLDDFIDAELADNKLHSEALIPPAPPEASKGMGSKPWLAAALMLAAGTVGLHAWRQSAKRRSNPRDRMTVPVT